MATKDHTATTSEEFARLFPDTNRPFAVYYTTHPEAGDCRWCINDEDGTPLNQIEDMEVAFKLAEEKGKEWREEARLQELAIAKLREGNTAATVDNDSLPANAKNLRDACDELREAAGLAEFVQSISLNVSSDGSVTLQPGQLFGFYIAMQDTIDRIQKAEALINEARNQPEVSHA